MRDGKSRRQFVASLLIAGALFSFCSASVAAEDADPALEFEPSAIRISKLRKGASVVLVGVTREPGSGTAIVGRYAELLTDRDSDGLVRFDLGRQVPSASVWVVAELANGRAMSW